MSIYIIKDRWKFHFEFIVYFEIEFCLIFGLATTCNIEMYSITVAMQSLPYRSQLLVEYGAMMVLMLSVCGMYGNLRHYFISMQNLCIN